MQGNLGLLLTASQNVQMKNYYDSSKCTDEK